jgi:hypothetical protein
MIRIIQFTVECYFFQFKLCIVVVRSLGAWGNLGPNVGPLESERGQKGERKEAGERLSPGPALELLVSGL